MIYKSTFRLDEGKKQSIEMLTPLIGKDKAINAVKKLMTFDPTSPKNKYLDVLTKSFKAILIVSNQASIDPAKTYMMFIERLKDEKVFDKLKDIESRNLTLNQSKIKDFPSFMIELNQAYEKITKSTKKLGMGGLKPNKDYIEIPLPVDDVKAYIPLHYKASKIIASDKVGGCEGKWCTAYQKTDDYWIDYIEDRLGILVYVIDDSPSIDNHDDLKKTAVYIHKDFVKSDYFDMKDELIFPQDVPYSLVIDKYVKAHEDMIREALSKNFKQVDPNDILQDGIMGGIITKVINAIELGADVNKPFEELDRITPLMLILHRYDIKFLSEFDIKKMLTLLTDHGADWNKVNGDYAPIFYYFQLFRNDLKMIGFLETLNIKINWNIMSEGEYNQYPQEIFIQGGYQSMFPHILPILINMGMDIDKPLSKGESIRDFIKKYNLEDKFDLKEVYKSKFKRKSDVI